MAKTEGRLRPLIVGRNLGARAARRLCRRFQRGDLARQVLIPEQRPIELLLLAIQDIAQLLDSPLQVSALDFEVFETIIVEHLLREDTRTAIVPSPTMLGEAR